jgi:hypothetical protein
MIHSASSSLGRSGKVPCAGIGQVNAPASRNSAPLSGCGVSIPARMASTSCFTCSYVGLSVPGGFTRTGASNGACC